MKSNLAVMKAASNFPKAPAHLKRATRKWFQSVVEDYELQDHHVRLLVLACESWDRAEQARKILNQRGLSYKDRFGAPRTRPEVAIERDSRTAFARLLRELALDVETEDGPRPPTIGDR